MRWTNIVETQNADAFFEDYVREIIASEPASLPMHKQVIAGVETHWFEVEPGIVHIIASNGTTDDRHFAYCLVREQLYGHGYTHAKYTFDWDLSKTAQVKEATWDDVMAKSKRLIQSGNVQLLRNGAQNVVAQVQGDHGSYQCEFSRDDPNSQAITGWQCECPWDQYAFQRTRQWKKYEARPCSHLLAAYWKSLGTPTDEAQEQQQQPSLFNMPPTQAPQTMGMPQPGNPLSPPPTTFGEQLPIPGMQPGMAQGTPPGLSGPLPPPGPDILPQFPMDPALQPAIPPSLLPGGALVSVPGLRQPTPANPIQRPGGTFSSVQDGWVVEGYEVVAVENPQLVSLLQEDVGTAVGRSEAHGAGQPMTIPAGSVGEVLGTDPTTGMVNVYYTGPCKNNGPMEPHGVTAWHFPSYVRYRPDLRQPGPAVKRKY